MKNTVKVAFGFMLLFVCVNAFAISSKKNAIPVLTERVTDYAHIMTESQKAKITEYLESLDNTTGIQIGVVTVPSLNGSSIEDFSINIAQTWGLGDSKKDNGALLLVSLNDRKIRIEVGYGLEDKLTDTKCGLIIRNVIAPEFRTGNYAKGIYNAVVNMGGIASDNAELISPKIKNAKEEANDDFLSAAYALFFVIGWIILFSTITDSRQRSWLPWLWISMPFTSGRSSSHFSNSNKSSFHSDFSSGGGHFGGGGASGGW